jgi:hypothetical protein
MDKPRAALLALIVFLVFLMCTAAFELEKTLTNNHSCVVVSGSGGCTITSKEYHVVQVFPLRVVSAGPIKSGRKPHRGKSAFGRCRG